MMIAHFWLQSLVSIFPSLVLDYIALFSDTIAKKYYFNLIIALKNTSVLVLLVRKECIEAQLSLLSTHFESVTNES